MNGTRSAWWHALHVEVSAVRAESIAAPSRRSIAVRTVETAPSNMRAEVAPAADISLATG